MSGFCENGFLFVISGFQPIVKGQGCPLTMRRIGCRET